MLFNSIDFAVFLPIVFLLYWFVFNRNVKQQNSLILIVSYFFYGCWDWKFLLLIFSSSLIDYLVGLGLQSNYSSYKRKLILYVSIFANLGILFFFKYFDFFITNFVSVFSFFGTPINIRALNIVLPVGISFYTFQTLSYSIDVYNNRLEPTKDFIAFSAYVSFFPQLVAGPIERATHFLPQFFTKRKFDYTLAIDGLRQILWGFFKKIVIADRCAEYVSIAFNESNTTSGSNLVLGAFFFAFQIYGDFSGYSDIAIGVSKLFGFNLSQNFNFPYFSRDIAEFWRRWHISLTTWFRDYVYIPLGGSKVGKLKTIRNIFIVFIVSGFWHGASWTFIAWGIVNAMLFLPLLLLNKNRINLGSVAKGKKQPTFKELVSMLITFTVTVFAWIFFRANSIQHAMHYIAGIFCSTLFTMPQFDQRGKPLFTLISIFVFIYIEWIGREEKYAIASFGKNWIAIYRWLFYFILTLMILLFSGNKQEFIYFQF